MEKYKITLRDTFSFAIVVREAELTEQQVISVKRAIENKIIVYSKLSDGIHWNFVPEKIELI